MTEARNSTFIAAYADLINNEQYIISVIACSVVWILLSLTGVIANIINIRTFIVMGLTDNVTVSFLALSIFDLSYVIMSLCLGMTSALFVTENFSKQRFSIEPYGVSIFFFNIMILINVTNMLATTYIAVARCICVVTPLQFKNTFTRMRAIAFMIGITLFAIASYTPILANMRMLPRREPVTKQSRPSLWVSASRESIKISVWVFIDVVLPFTTQFIIIVCIVVMASSLRAALKFRQASRTQAVQKNVLTFQTDQNNTWMNSDITTDKLAGKDMRVVQQVVRISVVYIVCNAPKIIISVAASICPDFTIGKRYTKLYICVNSLGKHLEIFNSTINLFIYFKYNTRFRSLLTLRKYNSPNGFKKIMSSQK